MWLLWKSRFDIKDGKVWRFDTNTYRDPTRHTLTQPPTHHNTTSTITGTTLTHSTPPSPPPTPHPPSAQCHLEGQGLAKVPNEVYSSNKKQPVTELWLQQVRCVLKYK